MGIMYGKPVSLTRRGDDAIDPATGRPMARVSKGPETIEACAQPLSPKEAADLGLSTDGKQSSVLYKLYTMSAVMMNDVVEFQDGPFIIKGQVVQVMPYFSPGSPCEHIKLVISGRIEGV